MRPSPFPFYELSRFSEASSGSPPDPPGSSNENAGAVRTLLASPCEPPNHPLPRGLSAVQLWSCTEAPGHHGASAPCNFGLAQKRRSATGPRRCATLILREGRHGAPSRCNFGRSAGAVCACGMVEGIEVGGRRQWRVGRGVGWQEGDSEGTRRGTRRGLAGDFWGTRAPFGGLAQKSGAFSSGFRGTRPRPRGAFIILKGGSEVLEVACGVHQSSTIGPHLKFYGPLFVAYMSWSAF